LERKTNIKKEDAKIVVCKTNHFYKTFTGMSGFGEPNYISPNLTIGKKYEVFGWFPQNTFSIIDDAGIKGQYPEEAFEIVE